MGGSGGGSKKKSSAPPQAQPLDMNQIMGAASAGATAQIGEQYKQLIANYPKLEDLSFGTVKRLAGNLDNQATKDAQAYIRRGLEMGDLDPQAADPTSIEQALYAAGERDLALGRSLSPEQERAARQSARAAFAARGLGTSLGSSAAEILNRDAAASARERERQGFAAAANDQYIGGITGRRMNLANLYFGGAGNLLQADPYARSVGPGLGLGMQTQGSQMQQIGNAFNSANELAGGVASFNANMLDSRYNSHLNNQAALRAAGMQAAASRQAGTMGMIGGIAQGLGTAAALPLMFSDKRMKKDIRPIGSTAGVLGLTAYEYRYKDEDSSEPKRIGFLAQDVQKVLPEAVKEVTVMDGGKKRKRLAIKPAVIGAALTEALMKEPEDSEDEDLEMED